MIRRVLQIGRWKIKFFFAKDGYDEEEILASLYDLDAPLYVMQRAYRIMESGRFNRGFTYPNTETFEAVVVVGPTTSGRQFQNTFVHEIRHMANAIASKAGYELEAEEPSYISGDAAMALADVVCKLGCEHCRDNDR